MVPILYIRIRLMVTNDPGPLSLLLTNVLFLGKVEEESISIWRNRVFCFCFSRSL